MFQRILIPLDLTEKHHPALAVAADMAKQSGGELILLHVIETIPGLSEAELKGFYARIEKTASEHLEQAGKPLTGQRIPWHSKVTVGFRVEEIVRFAEQQQVNLILLTAPQLDPANPGASWASLSWKIALMAHCPVLLVK